MVETVCMPGKFAALCRELSNDQRNIVEKIGLGSLLSVPSMPIQRMLVEKLVENFNAADRAFKIKGHVVSISPWDVYCILGLVDKGEKIEISRKQADRKWFDLYKEKGDTAITFKHLEKRIPRESNPDHFARMFMLYAMGTILAPSSKGYVSSNYLEIVVEVSRIKCLNWARFTLDHLLENLSSFKMSKRTGLAGNLALFQVWFFEHFQAAGDGLDYALHQHPLIRNWDEPKVLVWARLEAIKKFGAEKVVIELEPNESKVPTVNDNFDEEIGDQYNEGVRQENLKNEDWKDNIEEEIYQDDVRDATMDDKSKIKESMESVKSLLERFPEFHTVVQMFVKIADGSNSSGHSKPRESQSNVHRDRASPADKMDQSEKVNPYPESGSTTDKMDKSEKVKPCPEPGTTADNMDKSKKGKSCREPGTTAEREIHSGTSEQSNLSSRAKRKIYYGSSPTLVEKVKTRTNRQPSKICKSPYTGTKQKRVSKTKTTNVSSDDISEGLNLSDLELHAISYVREEFAINPKKDLVHIGDEILCAKEMKCLVTPVTGDEGEKWIGSGIISTYATIFNSNWNKNNEERKYAVTDGHSQWLQFVVGKKWIQTGSPWYRLCLQVAQNLVGADMVFVPMNTRRTHWWLCVIHAARNEIQVLDSFNRSNYAEETKELLCGIHSILQAIMSSSEKLESRWSNYDILKWDVVVKKNIPRQHDACSCGIFTIKYMQYWKGSEITSPFSQNDMEKIRKKCQQN